MGYSGRWEDKLKAQELRKQGLSYGEILQQIQVSKDTLSRWCKDIPLTNIQKQRLLSNKSLGQRKGSLQAADNKRQERIKRTATIFGIAKKEIGNLSKRDRFIAGIMLYAGEGDKADGKGGFTSSDPRLVSFMMSWFKDYCHISPDRFRGAIWLHEGRSESQAKKYWSQLTGIPEDKFHKTYIAKNKVDSSKVRKSIHEHGIFAIRFSDSDRQRKIIGWISALLGDKIPLVIRVLILFLIFAF